MYGFHRSLNIEKKNMSTGNGFYIQDCEKKAMNPFIIFFEL